MTADELKAAKEYATGVRDGFKTGGREAMSAMILALVAEIELRDRLAAADALIAAGKRKADSAEELNFLKGLFR